MAAKKKTAKKTASKQTNKSAFVRSLPQGTTAKDAVAKAKAAGIELTENYFYTIRSSDRVTAKKKSKKAPVAAARAAGPSSSGSSLETNFRKLVLDLGLAKAKALLDEVERGLKAVIAGK